MTVKGSMRDKLIRVTIRNSLSLSKNGDLGNVKCIKSERLKSTIEGG